MYVRRRAVSPNIPENEKKGVHTYVHTCAAWASGHGLWGVLPKAPLIIEFEAGWGTRGDLRDGLVFFSPMG